MKTATLKKSSSSHEVEASPAGHHLLEDLRQGLYAVIKADTADLPDFRSANLLNQHPTSLKFPSRKLTQIHSIEAVLVEAALRWSTPALTVPASSTMVVAQDIVETTVQEVVEPIILAVLDVVVNVDRPAVEVDCLFHNPIRIGRIFSIATTNTLPQNRIGWRIGPIVP